MWVCWLICFASLVCSLSLNVHCKIKIGASWPADDRILQVTYGGELILSLGVLQTTGGCGPATLCWQGHRWLHQHSGNVSMQEMRSFYLLIRSFDLVSDVLLGSIPKGFELL